MSIAPYRPATAQMGLLSDDGVRKCRMPAAEMSAFFRGGPNHSNIAGAALGRLSLSHPGTRI